MPAYHVAGAVTITSVHSETIEANSPEEAEAIFKQRLADGEYDDALAQSFTPSEVEGLEPDWVEVEAEV